MTTPVVGRQYPLLAHTPLMGIANIGAGNGYSVAIPPGGYVTGIVVETLTAFDGTTNTITVGDGTTNFVNAQDVKTTGVETTVTVNKYYPTGGTITASMAQTGTATVGSVFAAVTYIVLNRANEVYVS